jgi:hypothetical protein
MEYMRMYATPSPKMAADLSNDEIMSIVKTIRSSKRIDKKEHFASQYQQFAMAFPMLFHASLNPAFPLDQLAMMLEKRTQVNSGSVTVDAADAEVYETLKDKYVYPVLDRAGIPYDKTSPQVE